MQTVLSTPRFFKTLFSSLFSSLFLLFSSLFSSLSLFCLQTLGYYSYNDEPLYMRLLSVLPETFPGNGKRSRGTFSVFTVPGTGNSVRLRLKNDLNHLII